MITGIGIDITDINRITRIYEKFGSHFLSKILTTKELSDLKRNPILYAAGRWAAKEAGVKALGIGFNSGISFKDIEISNLPNGKPQIHFSNRILNSAEIPQIKKAFVSISHERTHAIAMVLLEGY